MSDQTATTRIRNADWVVAFDASSGRHVYRRNIDVEFAGGAITHVGTSRGGAVASEIDGGGLMVMPGLINVHSHPTSESMLKGLTDEAGSPKLYNSSLYEYLFLFQNDAAGTRAASEVSFCELLTSGVTTLCDLSLEHEGWLDTLGESGLRAYAAPMFRSGRWRTGNGHSVSYEWNEEGGRKAMESALRLIDRARQHPSGRLSGMVCPAQIDTCTAELISSAADAARERNLPFQIHAAQSVVEFHEIMRRHGKTPIEWLQSLGALGPNALIGHGIFLDHHSWLHWTSRDDMGRLAQSGTNIAHCPTVFMRRGITLQDFGAYKRVGINIGIGTDTFPHNFIEEMRNAAYAARIAAGNVHALRTTDIFDAATLGGAKALGRDDIGRIAAGAKADLVLVDVTHPAMRPVYDPIRSLIYAAGERAIRQVFVDGRQVVKDGKALAFDYADAAARLEAAQARSIEKVPQFDWGRRSVSVLMPPTYEVN
ncbi:MAG TPA: amidohydrolase family protein [Candidatus Polarisedimenticolia bacterium]|nr:amidohydrolase family protein [Candidatus Polarisedimenticolia bacterium]